MNGFKLIAVRPLDGCNKKFLKIIKTDTIYQFYNDYKFVHKDGDKTKGVNEIIYTPSIPESLYNKDDISINISAIVGKNGSGKSSLIELIFAAIYNISVKVGILEEIENSNGNIETLEPLNELFLEIFYSIDGIIYCLRLGSGNELNFNILKYESENPKHIRTTRHFKLTSIDEKRELQQIKYFFFYTIAINYSLYGLNSNQMGIWVKSLFHKNDGYQTPVVINPYREDGNIDINREQYLAKQRLLSNILKPTDKDNNSNYRFLSDSQKVEAITFSINQDKIEYAFSRSVNDEITFEQFFKTDNKDVILNNVYDDFFGFGKRPNENVKFKVEVELYIIKKLIKIARTYPDYWFFFHDNLIEHIGKIGATYTEAITHPSHFENLPGYLLLLKKDESHLTFKLRQALNYLMNDLLQEDILNGFHWKIGVDNDGGEEKESLKVSVDNLSKKIENILKGFNLIEFIPPSLFDIELHLFSSDNSRSLFSQMSSGEQQLIHTIQSIIYHAINVNSVFAGSESNEDKLTYKSINLVLDEVELYFHPEFQRKFVLQLVSAVHRINLPNIKKFNILFITHSTFILSDFPSSNILRLIKGEPQPFKNFTDTFGANIHKMLADDFYMDNCFIGEFAKQTINNIIDILIQKKPKKNDVYFCKNMINLIGDPVIKKHLRSIYDEKFHKDKPTYEDLLEQNIDLKRKLGL